MFFLDQSHLLALEIEVMIRSKSRIISFNWIAREKTRWWPFSTRSFSRVIKVLKNRKYIYKIQRNSDTYKEGNSRDSFQSVAKYCFVSVPINQCKDRSYLHSSGFFNVYVKCSLMVVSISNLIYDSRIPVSSNLNFLLLVFEEWCK